VRRLLTVVEPSCSPSPGSKPLRPDQPDAELERLLDRIEEDASRHHTAGPASEADLARLETALGRALPAPFRAFLERSGSGLYYDRHEIFGPLHTMIHDIELVPPLLSVCRGLPPGVIPVHRADELVHFMDLRALTERTPVFSLLTGERHPDFAAFLRDVVVPRRGGAGGAS
jgi:hypothetical protein